MTPGLARYPVDKATGGVIAWLEANVHGLDYDQIRELYRLVLTANDARVIRALGLIDRYFLLTVLLRQEWAFHPWLYARCREVEANPDGYLDLWAREHGKALATDTPVPTPDGWVMHGDLKPGDRVFGPDGSIRRVVAVTGVMLDTDCYRIKFDKADEIVCSGNHLWRVGRKSRRRIHGGNGRRHRRDYSVQKTSDLAKHDHAEDDRYSIDVTQPVFGEVAALPIDPYVLGVWLGDGTSGAARITAHVNDAQHLTERLERAGHTWAVAHQKGNAVLLVVDQRDVSSTCIRGHARDEANLYRGSCRTCKALHQRHVKYGDPMPPITATGLARSLRELGLMSDPFGVRNGNRKHIPPAYLRASVEQRWELLRGLMDSDGHSDTRGTALFCNTNRELAEGAAELARSLGLKPTLAARKATLNGRVVGDVYHVQFQAGNDPAPFALPRKVARCAPLNSRSRSHFIRSVERTKSVPVSCIQVDHPDGMYVAGKSWVPTHNSSVISFAGSVQEILRDPEVTIGIFSHTRPKAKDFLRQIMTEFATNEVLKQLYDDVLWAEPRKQAPKWSEDDGLRVRRTSNKREETVEAWGLVDGMPTGKHYELRIYDDVVVDKSVTTTEMIEKTTNSWALSQSLAAGERARCWHIGTRYAKADTYHAILERKAAIPRLHPATDDGTETGNPVFFTRERLQEVRAKQGPYLFAAQYLQNPTADKAQGFREEWLRYWRPENWLGMNRYLLCDPASEKKKGSDYTVFMVVGLGADKNLYVIRIVRDRLNLSERTRWLFQLHRDYSPHGVGYEKYGKDSDIEHIEDVQERENYRFDITPLGGQVKKADRIKRLQPVFEQGRIYLPDSCLHIDYEKKARDMTKAFVDDEYLAFPVPIHDDMLDCLARILEEDMAARFPKGLPLDQRPKWMDKVQGAASGAGWMAQ